MGTCTYGSGADMGKPAIGIWYGALCRAYTSAATTCTSSPSMWTGREGGSTAISSTAAAGASPPSWKRNTGCTRLTAGSTVPTIRSARWTHRRAMSGGRYRMSSRRSCQATGSRQWANTVPFSRSTTSPWRKPTAS